MLELKCKVAKNQCCIGELRKDYYVSIETNNGRIISLSVHISELLGLTYEEYEASIRLSGAKIIFLTHYFKTEKQCQEFIEKFVEPRLIINKLISYN